MKKGLLTTALLLMALVPSVVGAQERQPIEITDENKILAQETKYYKTVTRLDNVALTFESRNGVTTPSSYTVEVTEEEYNNVNPNATTITRGAQGSVETTYKKMTTYISEVDSTEFQYKNVLIWKTMPSVRSYDIIGIGHHSTVKISTGLQFRQEYCETGGSCGTNYINTPQTFNNGAGTSFLLKSGNLSSLQVIFYYYVEKNTNATINALHAYGDYSHAITTVSDTSSQDYIVNVGGIVLGSSITASYDGISSAHAALYGLSW